MSNFDRLYKKSETKDYHILECSCGFTLKISTHPATTKYIKENGCPACLKHTCVIKDKLGNKI